MPKNKPQEFFPHETTTKSKQIRERVQLLLAAKQTYYQTDTSKEQNGQGEQVLMSDEEFDRKEEELRNWDPDNPYFRIVGSPNKESKGSKESKESLEDGKIRHMVPMLSMNKVKEIKALTEWFQSLQKNFNDTKNSENADIDSKTKLDEKTLFCVQPKVDGISASCYYKNGQLQYIATRGDGQIGRDIGHLAEYIEQIPSQLDFASTSGINQDIKKHFEVRGEIYLPKDTKLKTNGKPLRNICSGLINRKIQNEEHSKEDLQYLNFVAYQCPQTRLNESEHQQIAELAKLGFHTVPSKLYLIHEIAAYAQHYLAKLRDTWNYETDGLIICIDNSTLFKPIDAMKSLDHHHHYTVALKPPADSGNTILHNISWQIGRHGRLIPVAQFLPLRLNNAVIERASLHNYGRVCDLKLHRGDILEIERSGDVIPSVRNNLGAPQSLLDSLDSSEYPILHCTEQGLPVDLNQACAIAAKLHEENQSTDTMIPQTCPACDQKLKQNSKELHCRNPECPEKQIQKILFWIQQAEMDQIAEQTVRQLYDLNKLKSLKDLYSLSEKDFISVPNYGNKRINNFMHQIQKSRRLNVHELIGRLGIPDVQQKNLMRFGTWRRKLRWAQIIQKVAQNGHTTYDEDILGEQTRKEQLLLRTLAHTLARVLPECRSDVELSAPSSQDFFDKLPKPLNQLYNQMAEQLLTKLLAQTEHIFIRATKYAEGKGMGKRKPSALNNLIVGLNRSLDRSKLFHNGFPVWEEVILSYKPHFLEIFSLEDFINFHEPKNHYNSIENLSVWLKENQAMLQELLPLLEIVDVQVKDSKSQKKVCMTGNGPLPRKQLQEKLEAAGYIVNEHITKNTDILLVSNLDDTSNKLKKATALGIALITYEDFFKEL